LKNGVSEKEVSAWIDLLGAFQANDGATVFSTFKSALAGAWNPKIARGPPSPFAHILQLNFRDKKSWMYEHLIAKRNSKGNVSTMSKGIKQWLLKHDVAVWVMMQMHTTEQVLANLRDPKAAWRSKPDFMLCIQPPEEDYFNAEIVSSQHSRYSHRLCVDFALTISSATSVCADQRCNASSD
jgi:hypothetical protein